MDKLMEVDSHPPSRHHRRPKSDLSLSLTPSTPPITSTSSVVVSIRPEERGLRLIQILLTCATHASSSDIPRADACLRLLATLSSPSGDSMQRLATFLASSLASRLLCTRWSGILSALRPLSSSSSLDNPKARLTFARSLPYLPFAHAVLGRALLRSLAYERVVHLVDLGASHASLDLWRPVLRALSRTPRGLRLTCVSTDPTVLETLGSALAKEAEDLNVPFQFNPVTSSLRNLELESLRARKGEALAVTSVLALHQLFDDDESKKGEGRMERFLAGLRAMSPKVVVLAEQEAEHGSGGMKERFGEVMGYYSAVFDSVEAAEGAGMMGGEERAAVEGMLGREVENVVACEGEERVERHRKAESWVRTMGGAGFRQWRVWNDAGDEGRKVVESWPGNGRYGVAIYFSCPMICWHDRPLYAVSAWQCF